MRVFWLAVSCAALFSVPSKSGTSFDFDTTVSGARQYSYSGHATVDGPYSRIDVTRGTHPFFNPSFSVITQRNGEVLLVLDHAHDAYFVRYSGAMSGPLSTVRGFEQARATMPSVHVSHHSMSTVVDGHPIEHYDLDVAYTLTIDVEGQSLPARVTLTGYVETLGDSMQKALPWSLQFAAKTGFEEIDKRIAAKLPHEIPVRISITATRTISGGEPVTESIVTTAHDVRTVPAPISLFSPPARYALREPEFAFGASTNPMVAALPPPVLPPASNAPAIPAVPAQTTGAPRSSSFDTTVEVRVLSADVVVTGPDGKPVRGLSRDDFELLEHGAPRVISNFSEFRGPAVTDAAVPAVDAPRDERRRQTIFFIDDDSLHPLNRNRALLALHALLDHGVRAGYAVMIVTFAGGSAHLVLPLTTDRAAMEKAWTSLSKDAVISLASARDIERIETELLDLIRIYAQATPPQQPDYGQGIAAVDSFGERALQQLHMKSAAIQGVIASVRGIEGKKALILLTEAFSDTPARELFEFFDSVKDKFAGGTSQNPLGQASAYEDHRAILAIVEAANSAGVTVYPVHAGGSRPDSVMPDSTHSMSPSMESGGRIYVHQVGEVLHEMAGATGGIAITGTTALDRGVGTIVDDFSSYYSLGYHATGERVDRINDIAVRVKGKNGFKVRTRGALVETSPESDIRNAVTSNLFYPIAHNDLQIRLNVVGTRVETDGHVVASVSVKIPTASLTLLPDGTDLAGRFSLFAGFLRHDGVVSDIDRQTRTVRFPADSLSRRREITMNLEVSVEKGTDLLSLGVLDDVSHVTGFAASKLSEAAAP